MNPANKKRDKAVKKVTPAIQGYVRLLSAVLQQPEKTIARQLGVKLSTAG